MKISNVEEAETASPFGICEPDPHPVWLKYRCKYCKNNAKEWASPMCHQCQKDPNAKILVPPPVRVDQRSLNQKVSDGMVDFMNKGSVPITEK